MWLLARLSSLSVVEMRLQFLAGHWLQATFRPPLPRGSLHKAACFKVNEKKSASKTEATPFYNSIIRVACLPHCYSCLLVGGNLIKGSKLHNECHEYQKTGILVDHLRSYLLHLPKDEIAGICVLLQCWEQSLHSPVLDMYHLDFRGF